MTEQAADRESRERVKNKNAIRARLAARATPTIRWCVLFVLPLALAVYLLYASADRPIKAVVAIEDSTNTYGFGTLGQEADWRFGTTSQGKGQHAKIALHGIRETPVQFAVSGNPKVPIFKALLKELFRIDEDEIFAVHNGYGVLVRDDGRQREIRLLNPPALNSRSVCISDASVFGRKLSILIRGRLNGRQRGMLLTYDIPEFDWGHDWLDVVWLPPTSAERLERPFYDAAFQPNSHDWAILTRTGEVEYSWGRRIPAPDEARRLWFRDADTLVVQRRTADSFEFHTAALNVEPLEFSESRLSVPRSAQHLWDSRVIRSPDGAYALVLANFVRGMNLFGHHRLNTRSVLSLVSLADWTIQATGSESTSDWGATSVDHPYIDAVFSSDGRHLRLIRSDARIEVVDIASWIRQSGGEIDGNAKTRKHREYPNG